MKLIHSKGDFLNLPGHFSDGNIFSSVVIRDGFNKKYKYVEAELKISDCTRPIELSFSFETDEEKRNNIHKIDVMIENLKQFRKALIKANKVKTKRYDDTSND